MTEPFFTHPPLSICHYFSLYRNCDLGLPPTHLFDQVHSIFCFFKRRVVASIPHCVCLSVCWSVGRSVGRSKKLEIGIMSISCLKLNYLSTVIPQTIINELLAGTVPLKNHLPELFQRKNKENISGAFNYSRRLLHTHTFFV